MAGEVVFERSTAVSVGGRVIVSPTSFYLTGEDRLRIVSANAKAGVALAVQWRTASLAGETKPSAQVHTPNTDRSVKTEDYELGTGTLLNVTVFARSGAPVVGQTYVMVQLVRGIGAAAIVLGTLLGGYVSAGEALGFPGSPIQNSLESGGYYRAINGTAPAAGVEVSETVPAGARWQLLMLGMSLLTDGTVVNRWPILELLMAIGLPLQIVPPAPVPAGTLLAYDAAIGLLAQNQTTAGALLRFNVALPAEHRLLTGQGFRTFTPGLAAGDGWTQPHYLVREWLEL